MKKKIESFLFGVLLLTLGFAGGYITHGAGLRVFSHPPLNELARYLSERGVAVPAHGASAGLAVHEQTPPQDPADRLRAEADKVGRDVGHWNTQLEELQRRHRERQIRITLLSGRSDTSDPTLVASLHAEQEEIERAIEEVNAKKALALREADRLGLILDAHSVVDAGEVEAPAGS